MNTDDPFLSSDRPGAMRVGDADRERAADALRRHHAEGRLTDAEFEARVARCYDARTSGDLGRLFADLPGHDRGLATGPGWASAAGSRKLWRRHHPLALVLGGLLVLWLVGGVLSSLTWGWGGWAGHGGPHPFFVPVIVLFVVWRLVARRRRSSAA